MRKLLLAFVVLLAPALANAQTQSRIHLKTPSGSAYLLNGVAANASAGSRTVTVNTGGYRKLTWTVALTRHLATALTIACSASTDSLVTYANIAAVTVNGGAVTMSPATWTYGGATGTLTGNDAVTVDMGVSTYDGVSCVFGATSGDGTDLLKVSGVVGSP
jgi:hypothetical protein